MGLPVEINPLFVSSTAGYTVGRSLRFRSSASAYLNRTPSVAGNQQKFTYSVWLKRGSLSSRMAILDAYASSAGHVLEFQTDDTLDFYSWGAGVTALELRTTQVFRDPSGWYHIILSVDTTQVTASNRLKMYVNGVQITAFGTANYPTLNSSLYIDNNILHDIGRRGDNQFFFDGYLAEVNFIDGQQLTPSSFGAYDTNGVWQPAKYTGTYGTNGFYLPFSNTTSTTTLVQDSSGNGNNWTPNNISLTAGTTYDSMIDSPTVSASSSNYPVLNPTQPSGGTYQAGNQQFLANTASQWKTAVGTMFATSGKYYWEVTAVALPTAGYVWGGAASSAINLASSTYNGASALPIGGDTNSWGVGVTGGNIVKYYNGSATTFTAGTDAVGDVWMVAVDIDAAKIWFGRNGTWLGSGDPATGANAAFTNLSGAIGPGVSAYINSGATAGLNCGQRPFTYTPPTGYSALNTYNLPTPTIANGALYNAATLWTGNGTSQSIANSQSNGGNNPLGKSFYPDFVWYKGRTTTYNHALFDTIRGTLQRLSSNLTSAETTTAGSLTAFNSNGFSIGNDAGANQNTDTYVGWQWLAGAGSSSSNTSGSITSTVSANTTAGFSIVTYTGTGAGSATVGHGLGVAPNFVIVKQRDAGGALYAWNSYHSSLGGGAYIQLNTTSAAASDIYVWSNTAPSSTVITLGSSTGSYNQVNNYSGCRYVAYCFSAVRGYSAFGSYTGNGSTDGPFCYTGFKPRFIMIKNSSAVSNWFIFDTSRDTYNIVSAQLQPNTSAAEQSGGVLDVLSNGFKLRDTTASVNGNGNTIIYAAFAENPFNYSRAR